MVKENHNSIAHLPIDISAQLYYFYRLVKVMHCAAAVWYFNLYVSVSFIDVKNVFLKSYSFAPG